MKPLVSGKLAGLCIFFMIIMSIACKKEKMDLGPGPEEGKKYINVFLHPYLQSAEIDSAIAKLKVNGTEKVVKLSIHTDSLYADLKAFSIGFGTMTVQIYTKKKLEGKSLQFESTVTVDLQHRHNVRINGPQRFEDQNWRPRVIFNLKESDNLTAKIIVGIRPDDPYFEFQKIDPAWRHRIIVERVYYKRGTPNTVIAEGAWDCTNNCPGGSGDYINTTHFLFLAQQANNQTWNRVQFLVRLYNAPNNAAETYFDHDF